MINKIVSCKCKEIVNSLYIVRHGESEGNVISPEDNSFYDKPNHKFGLTEKGIKQAEAVSNFIGGKNFDGYFCSTFYRTQKTLSIMYPDVKPIIDSRLNEMWRGIWHTMNEKEIAQYYPKEKEIKEREGWYHYRPQGGQNCPDVELMIHSFMSDLNKYYSGKRVLIVGHGTWMILFWRLMKNRSVEEAEKKYKNDKYKNGSITIFSEIDGSFGLQVDNFSPPL